MVGEEDPGPPDRLPPIRERLRRGDEVLYYVPIMKHPITINETHAHVIGVSTGILVGFGILLGYHYVAFASMLLLVGYAVFGPPVLRSLPHELPAYRETVALRTVRWEPWHFLGLFLVALVGTLVVAG